MANFFPRWTNWLPLKIMICGILIVCGLTAGTWYYVTPKYTRVRYQPIQPVRKRHRLDRLISHPGVFRGDVIPCASGQPADNQDAADHDFKRQPVRPAWKEIRHGY